MHIVSAAAQPNGKRRDITSARVLVHSLKGFAVALQPIGLFGIVIGD